MINKILHFLIITLFFSLALINSHLLDFFNLEVLWEYFYINWNYEFSKVLFFNVTSGIIIFIFFIKNIFDWSKIYTPKIIYLIIPLLLISNIFSFSIYTSLLWNNEKWHGTLMFLNLIWIIIVLINLFKTNTNIKKTLLKTIITSSFIVSIIWTKEFLLPLFDYWDLSNRAISTFGHPNYLALYLILSIPIINNLLTNSKQILKKYIYWIILFFVLICLFLTKSVWAIFIFFNYLIYIKFDKIIKTFSKKTFLLIYIFLLFFITILVLNLYPEKLSSFISRFHIWETTLNIIFSDIKILILWNGLWNLDLVFEWFKNKQLYIFENYWFVADNSHNIFINIFYNFWIIWLLIFWYLIHKLYKVIISPSSGIPFFKGSNNKIYIEIIIIFLLFNLFNFSSIASYLVIVFIISLLHIKEPPSPIIRENKNIFIWLFFMSTSLFSIYFYTSYFIQEHKFYNNENYKTNNYLINKINSENIENNIFNLYYNDYEKLCDKLIENSASAENYFYCGNLLFIQDKEKAINYYNLWLKKLPDLWNSNSKYYNNLFINKKNLKHRFFSEKYSNLNIVLERVWVKR